MTAGEPETIDLRLDEPFATALRKEGGRPTKAQADRVRRVRIAIHRLCHGKGNLYKEIGILLGISEDSARNHGFYAETHYSAEDLEGDPGVMDANTRRYLERYWATSKDPEVRNFIATHRNLDRVRVTAEDAPAADPALPPSRGQAPARFAPARPRNHSQSVMFPEFGPGIPDPPGDN